MKTDFYDIESLANVFSLCNFKSYENTTDVFYLCDDAILTSDPDMMKNLLAVVYERNPNFAKVNGKLQLFDLKTKEANVYLAKCFGLSDAPIANNPRNASTYDADLRLVCDTDPNYDEDKHPFLFGYNSYNYDTTMLAMYLYEVFLVNSVGDSTSFQATEANLMRAYNDNLFLPKFKDSMPKCLLTRYMESRKEWTQNDYNDPRYRIRQNMLLSGRHLDVARMNERQLRVGLKRLIGMMGGQILESDKLKPGQNKIDTIEQFYELIAYNISDCVNLKVKLFDTQFYQGQFSLKKGLLASYPELIYEKQKDSYKPDIKPERVRRDRLCIDSSSAQFATKSLCPYNHLTDIPTVSFMYPTEAKAKEYGIARVNVLEEAKAFFYAHFPQPEVREKFDVVHRYYERLEGVNFNDGKAYLSDFGDDGMLPDELAAHNIADIEKEETCISYFNADGTMSSCFVLFGNGGIHGAELNLALFNHDTENFQKLESDMAYIQSIYPEPIDFKKAKKLLLPDGRELLASKFLKAGSTLKVSTYKNISSKKPDLFKLTDTGATKLNPTYVFTSADPVNHEDFTSYYPNLLRMMEAFFNKGLGYDRYAEILSKKQEYGDKMKDKTLAKEEKAHCANLREGTKLILNAASGAGDVAYETNIRMNNAIISMRIIGQLFSWRIGQAQTIAGARIPSTNTDGLYSVLEKSINDVVLAREAKSINVEIEPESTYLISKDANNRMEMDPQTGEIKSTSGGTLGCRKGPHPTKALAHPAILDWALAEYLIVAALQTRPTLGIDKPFDHDVGLNILLKSVTKFEPIKFMTMMQNIIASSDGSMNYIFGTTADNPSIPVILQHYNRVFIMKDGTPNTLYLRAANARAITPATKAKRAKLKERSQQHDPMSLQILSFHGITLNNIPSSKEAIIKKVTNIEDTWSMFVQNKDLEYLTQEEKDFIIDNLDYEKYLYLLQWAFEENWKNKTPQDKDESLDEDGEMPIEDADNTSASVNVIIQSVVMPADNADDTDEALDIIIEDDVIEIVEDNDDGPICKPYTYPMTATIHSDIDEDVVTCTKSRKAIQAIQKIVNDSDKEALGKIKEILSKFDNE